MENPLTFFWIFVVLGFLRIPFMLYGRQQIRNNPARQTAGTEDITFRTTILLRFKNPGRLLFPQHWYYGKASPIELIVRKSTFQVTRWGIGRRSRHYGGWFLQSSETTMWVATMRFFPLGQQECIVVAGSYPWRGRERQVELALGTQGRSSEIWAALAASGVRPLQQPQAAAAPVAPVHRELQGISYGIPRTGFGPSPAGVQAAPAPPVAVATSTTPTFAAPSPYVPNFESPARAAATRGRTARRTALTIGLVFCFPFLAAFIFGHSGLVHRQSTLSVTLGGSQAVATVSGALCTINGDEVEVAGTISATAPAPSGMTVYASVQAQSGGVGTGLAAHIPIPAITVGEPQAFDGVVTGVNTVNGDQCDITWVANTAVPTTPS